MKTITEQVKGILRGCRKEFDDEENFYLSWNCGDIRNKNNKYLCPTCKSNLSGMQTMIKSELEFLRYYHDLDAPCKILQERITDLKNALKLLEEK